jgi:hypothetical protein
LFISLLFDTYLEDQFQLSRRRVNFKKAGVMLNV